MALTYGCLWISTVITMSFLLPSRSRASIITVQLPFLIVHKRRRSIMPDRDTKRRLMKFNGDVVEAIELLFSFSFHEIFQLSFGWNAFCFNLRWRFLIHRCRLPFLTVLMYAIADDDCYEYWAEEEKKLSDQKQLKLKARSGVLDPWEVLSSKYTLQLRTPVVLISLRVSMCLVYLDKKETPHHRIWFFSSFISSARLTCAAF